MISFFFEDIDDLSLPEQKIINWLESIIEKHEFIQGDLSFIFASDQYILEINKQYLNHDYFTDVITFDYTDNNIISGDIFISVDRVKENSETFGVNFLSELLRVIVHGVLHLTGFNDKTEEEKREMTKQEDECLKLFGNVE